MNVGPRWTVPIELVRALALPVGIAEMTRIMLDGGWFQPHADVTATPEGFVASVYYASPRYPGRVMDQPIKLIGALHENRVGP